MTIFVPPMPALAPNGVGAFGVFARLSRNALTAFPSRCLDESVVRLRIPGCTLVLASGPDAVREILQTRAVDYGRLPAARRVLGPIVGRGLLVSEGEAWRRQRRAMAPAFTPRSVPVIAHHVGTCTDAFCERLGEGGDIDLAAEMQGLALDIAAVTMFSLNSASFGNELRHMVSGYMTTIGRLVPSDFLIPAALPTLLSWRRSRFRKRWRALIGALVAERRAQAPAVREAPRDLFDLMATAHGEGREDLLADEVATMIVAGHETTALALFWAFQTLAQVQQWQEEIADEASRLDLSPAAAAASLPKLLVTQAVIQETLRLYPPAFMTARRTVRATDVCGITVPKRAIVLVPFFLLHRNPSLWSVPEAFDPSRFLDVPQPDRYTYLPFGVGPNTCIGSQLAMTEAILVLARVVSRYRISLAPDAEPAAPVGIITTRPDRSLSFLLKPRRSADCHR